MLQYIAPKTIRDLGKIRAIYEKEKGITLEDKSIFGLPTFFGGANIKERKIQIELLEKMFATLNNYVHTGEHSPWVANLLALHVMIATCLYIQSQISSPKENSVLYKSINKLLALSKENFMSNDDKGICFKTASDMLTKLRAINSDTQDAKNKITTEEWDKLHKYLDKEKAKYAFVSNPYPLSTILGSTFQEGFSWVGMSLGGTAAQAVNRSAIATPLRLSLTSTIGSFLVLVSPTGSVVAISLAATTAATIALDYFFTVSLARSSGAALGVIGKGMGSSIGYLCDRIINLIWAVGSLAAHYVIPAPHPAIMDGIQLDGTLMTKGHPIIILTQNELPVGAKILQITDKGEVLLDNQLITDNPEILTAIKELNIANLLQPQEDVKEKTSVFCL